MVVECTFWRGSPRLIEPLRHTDRYTTTHVILFASKLQRILTSKGIDAVSLSLHPGVVATQNGLNLFPKFLHPLLLLVGKTPLQGATAALFAATAAEVGKNDVYKGSYLGPLGVLLEASPSARDEKNADDLWATTETFIEGVVEKLL